MISMICWSRFLDSSKSAASPNAPRTKAKMEPAIRAKMTRETITSKSVKPWEARRRLSCSRLEDINLAVFFLGFATVLPMGRYRHLPKTEQSRVIVILEGKGGDLFDVGYAVNDVCGFSAGEWAHASFIELRGNFLSDSYEAAGVDVGLT